MRWLRGADVAWCGDVGTEGTETFDWSRARSKLTVKLMGYPRRNLRGMRATLERLDRFMTSGEVGDPTTSDRG